MLSPADRAIAHKRRLSAADINRVRRSTNRDIEKCIEHGEQLHAALARHRAAVVANIRMRQRLAKAQKRPVPQMGVKSWSLPPVPRPGAASLDVDALHRHLQACRRTVSKMQAALRKRFAVPKGMSVQKNLLKRTMALTKDTNAKHLALIKLKENVTARRRIPRKTTTSGRTTSVRTSYDASRDPRLRRS